MTLAAVGLLVLAAPACSTAPAGLAGAPSTRHVEAETRVSSPRGMSLAVPAGWFVTTYSDRLLLEDPDRQLSLTLVESREPEGLEAIHASWKRLRPDFARPVRRTMRPPSDPWDDMIRVEYETTTAEARTVVGIARRKGEIWYVALLDGPRAALDRRAAQTNSAFSSLRVPNLVRESWRGRTPRRVEGARAAAFEAFVEDARRQAQVPGAAVAVVQDGAVVYTKGFGTRVAGGAEPVTPDTLFMIGSITKSLTSLMMAVLVDRQALTWDTPVTRLLPEFALGDADATRRLTLKHTVCACTGLPRQDMEFFFGYSRATPESRLAAMRTMTPTTGFGETFQYSNSLVSAGGFAAARARHPDGGLGPAYDAAMRELVLDPVGMTRTTFDFAAAAAAEPASPHGLTFGDDYVPLPLTAEHWLPPIRPAGGAWSSARDLARYLLLELGDGVTPEARRVVSREALRARRAPQVKTDAWSSYALALTVENVRDVVILGHGGSTSGFSALMFFVPAHGLGGIVLTNAWGAFAFTGAVRARLLELVFDGREEAGRRLAYGLEQRAEMRARERARTDAAPPVAALQRILGTYENASLGRISVRAEGARVVLDAGDWRSTVGRQQEPDGTIKLVLLDPPWTFFELIADASGERPRLIVERPQARYVFEPLPAGGPAPSAR